jgi:protein MpaA
MSKHYNQIGSLLLTAFCCALAACVETTGVATSSSEAGGMAPPAVVGPAPAEAAATMADQAANETVAPAPDQEATQSSPEPLPEATTPAREIIADAPNMTPDRTPVLLKKPAPAIDTLQLAMQSESVNVLCEQIGSKLGSVSIEDCNAQNLRFAGGYSINQRPLVTKEIVPVRAVPSDFKVLIMGGIHGDEYSSISIMFKWLELFSPMALEGEYHWRFAPLVNPDGLLDGQAKRQNANGVDLNRNFPSEDWNDSAVSYWQESTGSNPRRYPGNGAASEPEVKWLVDQIEDFQPDVIVSVHAPYHLLDFDGPAVAPDKIGELYLHQLGVYPGSLGNYAGLNKRIPVVTLELPSAGIMPPDEQINLMWDDLVNWLDREGRKVPRNVGAR